MFDEPSLRVLEYGTVRARVAGLASTNAGRELCELMQPGANADTIGLLQSETREAASLLQAASGFPLGGLHDLRPALKLAALGGTLTASDLLLVSGTIAAMRKLRRFLAQREQECPVLAAAAVGLRELPEIETQIDACIDQSAEVRDEASPALAKCRKEVRTLRQRMMDRLHTIVRSVAYREMIQDPVVTTRDGRYCIPVKAEYRVQFGGLVHDQSTSGATLFMEPQSVVEIGNELRQRELQEAQEVERILTGLTRLVAEHETSLIENQAIAARLDGASARGRYAVALRAVEPELSSSGPLILVQARHPLLEGEVVPTDLRLDDRNHLLVITGPNTGGKTVALKTVGLLALMAQSGLHVPAAEGTRLPIFRGVFADIGDEQSIHQSLSTFSGHVTNIARILKGVAVSRARSLVLLDEIGAGTDPSEGAALARAILGYLLGMRSPAIVTTHYGELKEYAYTTPGVQNASVEFDQQTLRPTYRLLQGTPGSSNALTIAQRLGMPQEILDVARQEIGGDRTALTAALERVARDEAEAAGRRREAESEARAVRRLREEYDHRLEQLRKDREDVMSRARAEMEEMVRAARRELELAREDVRQATRSIRRAGPAAPPKPAEAPEHLRAAQERLTQVEALVAASPADVVEPSTQTNAGDVAAEPAAASSRAASASGTVSLDPGRTVWIEGLNQRATILAAPEHGMVPVQIGVIRTTVPVADVRPATPEPVRRTTATSGGADIRMRARSAIASELHIRGLRAEEALGKLETYVDEACLAGLSPFRVVHGVGTGALKRVVWEYLKSHPNVGGFHHPPEEEGGTGVTVVRLRDE